MKVAPTPLRVPARAAVRRESGPVGETDTALRGRALALARVGWLAATVLAVGLLVATLPRGFAYFRTVCVDGDCALRLTPDGVRRLGAHGLSTDFYAACWLTVIIIFAAACCATAALLVRHSSERMALLAALMLVLCGVGFGYPLDTLVATQPVWRWVAATLDIAAGTTFYTFPFLFPDGRLVPRWTRPLVFVALVVVVARSFGLVWSAALEPVQVFGLLLAGIVAQLYRYRRVSGPAQRQQTKWVVFGLTAALGGFIGLLALLLTSPSLRYDPLGGLAWQATLHGVLLLLPLSLALAILRKRLWDVDVLINRTLVYGALTACVVGLYVLVVGYLSTLFRTGGSLAISLVATGLVAVLFQPLRERLQRRVNHLVYGERDDPYAVLSRLGQRLEATLTPEAVLATIVQTVREALRLPYAAITLKQDDRYTTAAAAGIPVPDPLHLPLVYQQETVGALLLASPAPGEGFDPADRRLLDDLARQAGVAAHAARLAVDLQRSRERLVAAREEERRRLRRDLHDGLGPRLSSLALQLAAARNRVAHDPVAADLLAGLKAQAQEAVADIRRLVYALRPPALDELGLVSAIREHAARYRGDEHGPCVVVEVPDPLPPLPAAVEVAAYRIVLEALTNVVRHAQARHCVVRLALDADTPAPLGEPSARGPALCLEIVDDGRGVAPDARLGAGVVSMRERTGELGGTFTLARQPLGGTRVCARLPLPLPVTREGS